MLKTAPENNNPGPIGRIILNEEKTQFLPDHCPFCGSNSYTVDQKTGKDRYDKDGNRYSNVSVSIRCNKCHARGPTVSYRQTTFRDNPIQKCRDEAYEKWCKRV